MFPGTPQSTPGASLCLCVVPEPPGHSNLSTKMADRKWIRPGPEELSEGGERLHNKHGRQEVTDVTASLLDRKCGGTGLQLPACLRTQPCLNLWHPAGCAGRRGSFLELLRTLQGSLEGNAVLSVRSTCF